MTEINGTSVWKSVIVPELTEVSAVVAIAVNAPGMMKAATYIPTERKMISTRIPTPSATVEARMKLRPVENGALNE